jgi:polysaccharide biosynthesis protein PelC
MSSEGEQPMSRSTTRRALIAVLIVGAAGCGGPARYVNPTADFSAVKTVAVLPFENLSGDKVSSERVQRVFLTELLVLNTFQVVEPGQTNYSIRRANVDVSALTADDIKKLGTELKADALFTGTVIECVDRAGSAEGSRLSLQLRLVEVETGQTLWSSSSTRKGATFGSRMFGFSAKPSTTVAQELIRDELHGLVR